MIDYPILMSSDRYKRMREAGYIDEHGCLTQKAEEGLTGTFARLIAEHQENDNEPDRHV